MNFVSSLSQTHTHRGRHSALGSVKLLLAAIYSGSISLISLSFSLSLSLSRARSLSLLLSLSLSLSLKEGDTPADTIDSHYIEEILQLGYVFFFGASAPLLPLLLLGAGF